MRKVQGDKLFPPDAQAAICQHQWRSSIQSAIRIFQFLATRCRNEGNLRCRPLIKGLGRAPLCRLTCVWSSW